MSKICPRCKEKLDMSIGLESETVDGTKNLYKLTEDNAIISIELALEFNCENCGWKGTYSGTNDIVLVNEEKNKTLLENTMEKMGLA